MKQKPTYQDLEKELKKLSTAVKQSASIILITDNNGIIEYVNDKFVETTGYKAKDVIGENPRILNAGNQPKDHYKKMWETIKAGNNWKGEFCNKTKKGKIYWEQATITPIKDENNNIINFLGVKEDITERKKAEETLSLFKKIVESTSGHMSFIDANYVYLEVNNSYVKAHKKKREEIIGYTIADILGNEVFVNVIKDKIDACFSGKIVKYENWFNFVGIGKRYMGVSYYPYFDEKNIISGVIVDSHDITERKQAEETLKVSEESYKSIFDNNPLPLSEEDWSEAKKLLEQEKTKGITINREYFDENPEFLKKCISSVKVIRVNQAILDLFKYKTSAEVINNITNLFNKKTLIIVKNELISVANNECSFREETELLDSEGNLVSAIIQFKNIENYKKVIFSITEITERKNAEEILRASEERFRILTETMKDVVVRISKTGELLYVSPSVEKFGGYKPKEEIGKHISNYFANKTDLIKALKLLADILITKKSGSFEFLFKPKNKAPFPIEHTYVPLIRNDKVYAIQLVLRDITERKEAEVALKESEERFIAIFNNNPNPIHLVNSNYEIVSTNSTLLNLKRLKQDDILGKKCYEVYQNNNEVCQNCAVKKVFSEKKSFKYESKLKIPNGKMQYFETHAYPILDEQDNVIYAVENIVDITKIKGAEQELKESEANLRESNVTKDKFFSIIAHDLRSPFNSMLGFVEILENDFDKYDTAQRKRFINIIHKGLKDTFNLLENLLYWSRSQRGTIEFNSETINLYLLFRKTSESLILATNNKSIKLINQIAENIYVKADKNMLAIIIRNLLSNAIKYTHKFGEITIKTFLIPDENNIQYVGISVSDTGVGVPKEIKSSLFDIGEHTSMRGTENEKGTGLGLVLCKEFVEKHGGKIWVESEVGKGSSFFFSIPMSK